MDLSLKKINVSSALKQYLKEITTNKVKLDDLKNLRDIKTYVKKYKNDYNVEDSEFSLNLTTYLKSSIIQDSSKKFTSPEEIRDYIKSIDFNKINLNNIYTPENIYEYLCTKIMFKDLRLTSIKCECKNKTTKPKKNLKRKRRKKSQGRPIFYPLCHEGHSNTFYLSYPNYLSVETKLLLNSFRNKYIHYAIDDILDILNSNSVEKSSLLTFLYSCMIFLHKNFYVSFFDIWIEEIYVKERATSNRFLFKEDKRTLIATDITLKLLYKIQLPIEKPNPLW